MLVCRNDDNMGQFEALDSTCHKQAAIDERTHQKDFKAEPGQLFYAAPIDEDLVAGGGLVFEGVEDALPEADGGEDQADRQ